MCLKTLAAWQRIKMSNFFPKPYEPFGGDINITVNLSNYATKTDLINVTHVDTSSFALKPNLANLKTEVDKLGIGKLVPFPTDLSQISKVVNMMLLKKTVYDKLVTKVNNIDTNSFALKTKYDKDKSELENKIPNVIDFVKEAKLTEIATKTALSTVENKIRDVSNFVKKQIVILKLQ